MKQRLRKNLPVWQEFAKYNFMLYTKKGDNGTTKLFNCPQGVRLGKNTPIFHALGTLDELNCSIGYAKALAEKVDNHVVIKNERMPYPFILENIQNLLFVAQAELGGSPKRIEKEHVTYLEVVIYEIETVLPPVTSFIMPGGSDVASYLDICRTITRRCERDVVGIRTAHAASDNLVQFLNRLSSTLYALARFANYQSGVYERHPEY
jgi:cob(I)alamin adenosyltransferase